MRGRVGAPCRGRRDRPARGRAPAARGHCRPPGRAGDPFAVAEQVLILSGAPGVGKTTAGKLLARRFERGVHVPADRFFEFIQSGYVQPWRPESHEQNTLVMGVAADVARAYATAGYTTVLEGIVLPDWFLDPVRATLAEAGCAVSYAVLRAPLATCVQRAAERDFKPFDDGAVIERIWADFSELGGWESHAIEVGELSPEATADLLAARLAAGDLLCP